MTVLAALALVLLAPFFGGIGSLLLPDSMRKHFAFAMTLLLLLGLGTMGLLLEDTLRYEISGWTAPLGINLHIDGLSLAMLLLAGVVASSVSIYAYGYYANDAYKETAKGFWPLFFMLWGSLNTIFLVSDLFTMYVGLELITFASVALITIAKNREALSAALSYLMTALLGSVAYLLGIALIYGRAGVLDWTLLPPAMGEEWVGWIALSLITAGLVIKAALYPLHFWLPGAHAIAPVPVSALLSALVVKAPIFIMLRVWAQVFPHTDWAAHVIGALGAGAIIWGSFQAIIQERIKLMVAYSTVAQIGYIFLIFPLLAAGSRAATSVAEKAALWEGGIYFILSHGVAKSAMFLVAGIVLQATKTDSLREMHGAAARVPVAILVWGLAGMSLIGLPPSGGFIAKWQLLTSALRFGQWAYAAVILFGGLLASAYVFRVLWYAFLTPKAGRPDKYKVAPIMLISIVFLGTAIVVMGIRTADVLDVLKIGSPFPQGGRP